MSEKPGNFGARQFLPLIELVAYSGKILRVVLTLKFLLEF